MGNFLTMERELCLPGLAYTHFWALNAYNAPNSTKLYVRDPEAKGSFRLDCMGCHRGIVQNTMFRLALGSVLLSSSGGTSAVRALQLSGIPEYKGRRVGLAEATERAVYSSESGCTSHGRTILQSKVFES